MADVSVNGRALPHAGAADGGDLLRRLRPGLHRARHRRRHPADHRLVPEERLLRHRRLRGPELHQPQQRLDRHRRAAGRARHLRQLLPRPRHRRGAHDHRCLADALRHHPGRHGASGRQDRRRHGQGQAAPDAGARPRRASTSPPSTPTARPWRRTASATSRRWSAARSPTSTRAISRSTCWMPACACWSARRRRCSICRSPTSSSTRMRRERPRPTPSTAPSTSASRAMVAAGADRRRGRRSRHERQVAGRRRAQRRVPAGGARTARFGDGAVRVICPITDPFVRHHGALGSFVRVYARKATDLAALMAASRALPGVEAVLDGPAAARRFELPLDLEGDFVVLGDAGTVDRRHPRRARSVGPRRPPPALARGPRRAEGALHGLAQAAPRLGVGHARPAPCATSTSSMPCSTASNSSGG